MTTSPPMMSRVETTINQRSLPYAFYAIALTVLTFYILWVAQSVLVPVVTAIFLSFLVITLKQGIDRIPFIGKHLPSVITFTLAFAIIASTIFLLALLVKENISAVLAKAPEYRDRFGVLAENFLAWAEGVPLIPQDFLQGLAGLLEGVGSGLVEEQQTDLSLETAAARETLRNQAFSTMQTAVKYLTNSASGIIGGLVTTFLYTAFILVERGRLLKKIALIASETGHDHFIEEVLDDVGKLVRTYISIKTMISLFVAGISYAIMSLLGTDFAGFWALLIFAFGFVPIVGAVIAILLPTMLTLVQPDGGLARAFLTIILLTGAEQSVSSFIEPRLLGKSLNLSPLVILLSLATWGTIWGFPGMLLCVPMTVALLIILSQMEVTRPIAILLSDNGEIAPLKEGRTRMPPPETQTTPTPAI